MRIAPGESQPDAIVAIFGAAVRPDGQPTTTLRRRVDAAARFARHYRNPLFVPTGAKGRHGDAEAIVMAQLLTEAGFSRDQIQTEETGTDTLSSVLAISRMVPRDATVHACTSAYHLPRCLLLLRLAGLEARACPPPPEPAARAWLRRWYWRLREVPALPYDVVLILWWRLTARKRA